MKKIVFIFALLIIGSCKSREDEFLGIWIGDRDNYFNPDQNNSKEEVENLSLTHALPMLLDFKKNNNLTLKIFGYKSHNINWGFKKDSLLVIHKTSYKVIKITKDTITLNINRYGEGPEYKIYRIKNEKVKLDSTSIRTKITSNIWSNLKDLNSRKGHLQYGNYLEYFENNIRLLKYYMPPNVYQTKDSISNIQIDRWAIEKYKNYAFIANCDHQFQGTLPFSNIYQITKINDAELNIYRPQWFENKHIKFYKSNKVMKPKIAETDLIGLWKSYNSKNKRYSYYNREVKESEKYEGDLTYNFKKNELIHYGTKTDTLICNWYLNKDKTVLFYEYPYKVGKYTGVTVNANEIMNFKENTFGIHLFTNTIYRDSQSYLLNINQKFKKVKKTKSP